MNSGKQFEADFKASVPSNVYFLRLKDGTAAWDSSTDKSNIRFQAQNPFDCILFDGRMILLELKSHKGKSIPFSCIRENQLKELSIADNFSGIIPGIVFNFRDISKTYFVPIRHVYYYTTHADRKSIPLDWVQENGTEIKAELKKVHYRYYVKEFLDGIGA